MHLSLSLSEPKHSACSQRCRLLWFVVGSLLLHLLLVALWRGEPPAGPAGQSTFQITLIARHGDTPQDARAEVERTGQNTLPQSGSGAVAASEPSKPVASSERQVLSALQPATPTRLAGRPASDTRQSSYGPAERSRTPAPIEAKSQAENAFEAAPPAPAVATRGSTSHGQHRLTSAARHRRVRDELLRALLPYFEYPPVARRRGWQGRVRIGLLVKADGHLSGVQLLESSGYALLDKAAMKNVNQLRNVPAATQWLDGRDLDLVLPVTYRLE
jgi:protein TonB